MRPMPAFEVEKLEGDVVREFIVYDKKTKDRKVVKRKEPAGYHVYFSKGHSIRVRTLEELQRLELDRPARFIDADGEMDDDNPSLKEIERASLRRGRGQRTAPLDNPIGDE